MKTPPLTELKIDELEHMLARARVEPLSEEDCRKLKAIMETLIYVRELAEDQDTTIEQLRRILARSTRKAEGCFSGSRREREIADRRGA